MSAIDNTSWWNEVIKRPDISNATKLLMTIMADETRGNHVCVPRSVLAERLNVHPSRITQRIREAVDAGVLDVVVTGRPGVTAVYAPVLGAPVRTKNLRPMTDDDLRARGAPVRTTAWCGVQDQAVVHPSAPSATLTHGAPVQSTSSTKPQQSEHDVQTVLGDKPKRSEGKNDKPTTELAS